MHTSKASMLEPNHHRSHRGALGLAAAVVLAAACSVDSTDPSVDRDAAVAEIVENLERAGNPASQIEVRSDGVVVLGGDAVVTLAASREMLGLSSRETPEPGARLRQFRTTNLVGWSVRVVCIDGSAMVNPTLSAALDQAIATYQAQDLWFDMVRTAGADEGCDAEIVVRGAVGVGGLAGFPAAGLPYGTVYVGTDTVAYGVDVTAHVLTHELGHCIGLRHSDYYDTSISCGLGDDEGPSTVGAIHIPGTPVGAAWNGSVFNACFSAESTGVLTDGDVVALQELYAPRLDSCQHMNACGGEAPGGCFCDETCIQWGDCCIDGPCEAEVLPQFSCVASGSCGEQTPGGCFCDATCDQYGDCCIDGPC